MNIIKGYKEAFDTACDYFKSGSTFYDWIFNNDGILKPGQICLAPVWYEKKNRWYFEEHHYDAIKEENSTWYAKKYQTGVSASSCVKKFFFLEEKENMIATNSKDRPVVLIRYFESDWFNPSNIMYHTKTWLCLPIFSYKQRHNPEYILNDERFNVSDRIYLPPKYNSNPGIDEESAIQLQTLQMVKNENLIPLTCDCDIKEPRMRRPFKISDLGLKIILSHLIKSIDIFGFCNTDDINISNELKENYNDFVFLVNEIINNAMN